MRRLHNWYFLICLCCQFPVSTSIYSGSWCPYQEEKLVPCRVRNGTESYYGPNICWKSVNGSYSCTKKILHRPKFVTTYKKIFETNYKCCPGLEGENCQYECFNCSSYNKILNRLDKLEQQIEVTKKRNSDHFASPPTFTLDQQYHENDLNSNENFLDRTLTFLGLDTRITSLMSDFREMEARIRGLESEVFRLTNSFEDLAKLVHLSKNHLTPEQLKANQNHSYSHGLSPSIVIPTPETSYAKSPNHKSTLQDRKALIRQFEDNLERGDIASTLNDDYGEEILFDNSTEQYVDPLQGI